MPFVTSLAAVKVDFLHCIVDFLSSVNLAPCRSCLLQFWDYRQPRKYLNILSCQVPVWKARYTVGLTPAALHSTCFTERLTTFPTCNHISTVRIVSVQ